jgi:hypothetical protein
MKAIDLSKLGLGSLSIAVLISCISILIFSKEMAGIVVFYSMVVAFGFNVILFVIVIILERNKGKSK